MSGDIVGAAELPGGYWESIELSVDVGVVGKLDPGKPPHVLAFPSLACSLVRECVCVA